MEKLSTYVLKTFDILPAVPKIDIQGFNLYCGSGNAGKVAEIFALLTGGSFASSGNYKKFKERYYDNIFIISASGGRDALPMSQHFKSATLITNTQDSPASKFVNNVIVLPALEEPATYNVSTYAAMMQAMLQHTEKELEQMKESILKTEIIPIDNYSTIIFIGEDLYGPIAQMCATKVNEIFSHKRGIGGHKSEHFHGGYFFYNQANEKIIPLNTDIEVEHLKLDKTPIKGISPLEVYLKTYYILGECQKEEDFKQLQESYPAIKKLRGWKEKDDMIKAIVLAGGFATRLYPVTQALPKPLLPIGGKPMIDYIIEKLERCDYIDEIIVSTNKRFEDHFKNWLEGLNSTKKIRIVVEDALDESQKLGTIGAINFLINSQKIENDCLIIGGDNLIDFEISDFVNYYRQVKRPVIALHDIKDLEKAKKYGVAAVRDNKVFDFVEKPSQPLSSLVSTCCYIFPRNVLSYIPKYLNESGQKDAPGYFISWLKDREETHGFVFDNQWFDIGDMDSLADANKFIEEKMKTGK